MVLIGETDPAEDRKRGEEDQGRVEEDKSGLSDETVFKCDEKGSKEGCCGAAIKAAKGEIG